MAEYCVNVSFERRNGEVTFKTQAKVFALRLARSGYRKD